MISSCAVSERMACELSSPSGEPPSASPGGPNPIALAVGNPRCDLPSRVGVQGLSWDVGAARARCQVPATATGLASVGHEQGNGRWGRSMRWPRLGGGGVLSAKWWALCGGLVVTVGRGRCLAGCGLSVARTLAAPDTLPKDGAGRNIKGHANQREW